MRLLATILCVSLLGPIACDEDQDGTGREPVQAGVEAFRQGKYDQAIEAYRHALAKQPGQAHVHNLLGMAYRFKYNQQPDPATKDLEIKAFEKAVEIEPRFVVALVNLGSSYYHQGRKQDAARVFERVLDIMPAHPEAAQLKQMIEEAESNDTPKGEEAGPD